MQRRSADDFFQLVSEVPIKFDRNDSWKLLNFDSYWI